MTTMQTVKIIC